MANRESRITRLEKKTAAANEDGRIWIRYENAETGEIHYGPEGPRPEGAKGPRVTYDDAFEGL